YRVDQDGRQVRAVELRRQMIQTLNCPVESRRRFLHQSGSGTWLAHSRGNNSLPRLHNSRRPWVPERTTRTPVHTGGNQMARRPTVCNRAGDPRRTAATPDALPPETNLDGTSHPRPLKLTLSDIRGRVLHRPEERDTARRDRQSSPPVQDSDLRR